MSFKRRQYPFHLIEPKWQRHWASEETFRAWNPREERPADHPFTLRHGSTALPPKYYVLDMFPYPSGQGLHVGHPEGYTATDILARYRRALGYNVLHPMGWDAFGLPAEQYAVKTGQHPRKTTEENISNFRRQIKSLGFSYDWSREINTTDPDYFKWTQWIFLKLYQSWFNPETNKAEPIDSLKIPDEISSPAETRNYRDEHRLAYISEAPVNWCPELGTVLANEEVIDGKSEVGGFPVIRKPMRQWMLRITAYADRLLEDLVPLDWSSSLKEMQRNWIGRSEGAEVQFSLGSSDRQMPVFTTRPDTLFGATYMVFAPEHSLIDELIPEEWPEGIPDGWKTGGISGSEPKTNPKEAIRFYREYASKKSDLERTDLAKEKTGIFTGAYALNPVNQEKIPIWIADYVLISYGTGAIMAVPAHDSRDLEFARQFNLPVREVVKSPENEDSIGFTGNGTSINSGMLTGMATPDAKKTIIAWLEENGKGRKTIQFKLRDWLFSRQRYWGEPFPIAWDENGHECLTEESLPLLPPDLEDYHPTKEGQPPLARATEWLNLPDGKRRETNTMPQWAGSCWYYLRYLDPSNQQALCDPAVENYWMGTIPESEESSSPPKGIVSKGIDLYVGGAEHAVLHLLYARFWHKVLFDLGLVSTSEPFFKLVNQGLIMGEDGQKMSKSRGNVISPDEIVLDYGADSFRLYEMFIGPLEMVKPWNTKGVEGVYRFLGRVWRLFIDEKAEKEFNQKCVSGQADPDQLLEVIQLDFRISNAPPTKEQTKSLHACIQKTTEDLDGMRFNTAISALMIFINEAMTWSERPAKILVEFLKLLQPFAPHLAEELFKKLIESRLLSPENESTGSISGLSYQPWPEFNRDLLIEDEWLMPIQINGKLRDRVTVPTGASKEDLETAALASEKIQKLIEGKQVRKVIVVPRKLVNIAITS